jgi:hypothetical protein
MLTQQLSQQLSSSCANTPDHLSATSSPRMLWPFGRGARQLRAVADEGINMSSSMVVTILSWPCCRGHADHADHADVAMLTMLTWPCCRGHAVVTVLITARLEEQDDDHDDRHDQGGHHGHHGALASWL